MRVLPDCRTRIGGQNQARRRFEDQSIQLREDYRGLLRKPSAWKSPKKFVPLIDILEFIFELPKPRCPKRNPIVNFSLAAYATHSYACPAPVHVEIRTDFGAVIYEIQRCAPVRRRNHTQPSWG